MNNIINNIMHKHIYKLLIVMRVGLEDKIYYLGFNRQPSYPMVLPLLPEQ
jgi:hypothetical protein